MSDPTLLSMSNTAAAFGLDAAFAAKIDRLLEICRESGHVFKISQGTRSPQRQAKYYCSWVKHTPEMVDEVAAGLEEKGAPWIAALMREDRDDPRSPKWLTNALPGAGWHQWGLAVDAYCYRNGVIVDDGNDPSYKFYAEAATKLGLTAGFYFSHQDSGHVQGRSEAGASDVFSWPYIDAEMRKRFEDKDRVALGRDVDPSALAADFAVSLRSPVTAALAVAAGDATFFKNDPALQAVPLEPRSKFKLPARDSVAKRLAATYNRVGGLIDLLASRTSIDPFAVLAVWHVESGGRSFTPQSPVLRFENHIFFKFWGASHEAAFDTHFQFGGHAGIPGKPYKNHKYRPGATGAWQQVHIDQQSREWEVFRFATRLADPESACMSASFGGPQIMGFNFEACGYPDARTMAAQFGASEKWQVLAFFDFCNSKHLVEKIRAEDWTAFGQTYNGDGATYGPLLEKAFSNKAAVLAFPREDATNVVPAASWPAALAGGSTPSPDKVKLASNAAQAGAPM